MDVSTIIAVENGIPTWSDRDHITPQQLADLWASGITVGPRVIRDAEKGAKPQFISADLLMIRVSLAVLPLQAALDAPFTQEYGTVAAHSTDFLLLAFALPARVTDSKAIGILAAGLAALYSGAKVADALWQGYGLRGGGTAIVLGRRLDPAAVRRLNTLGLESRELAKGNGAYLRSHVSVDRSTPIRLPGGEAIPLEQLPRDLSVFCPVHVDAEPTATVHWFADGTPGVQCCRCKRTFTAPTTRRNYDFGYFDRTIRALAKDLAAAPAKVEHGLVFDHGDISYLSERYLPALDLAPGVTLVKSPKGTGKTEALAGLIQESQCKGLRVLLLGHRRALLQSISARLGLDCYFMADEDTPSGLPAQASDTLLAFADDSDAGVPLPHAIPIGDTRADEGRYQRVAPTRKYAICLDSMVEMNPEDEGHRYGLVIIDEAEQVFTHLTGETLKNKRREVYARLVHYLKVARHVVLLDADLDMVTTTAALEIFKPETPVRVIINEPTAAAGDVHVYGNRGQLVHTLTDRVRNGQKVFVATNSKRKAVDLSKLLGEKCPTATVAVVTADNAQRPETQELLGNIVTRFERDLDVLIASPAIGTGIDITFKDAGGNPRQVVDAVFGLFEANIVTHFDIDQQLMRVRHPGEVHVWIDQVELNYETDLDCIRRELEKSVRRTSYLLRYDDDGRPVFAGDDGLVNIWARVLAASRGSKNRLASLFRTLRIGNGWSIADVEHDNGAAELGKAALADAKEARLAERTEMLLSAEKLSTEEAQDLSERDEKGLPLSDAERYALERYRIENFYCEMDITEAVIDFDDEGRTRDPVRRLECLISNREWFEVRDQQDLDDNVVAFDRRRHLAQRDVLTAVFAAAGLFDAMTCQFRTDVLVDAASLQKFLDVLEGQRRQVEALFGVPLYVDRWRKPVYQLKGLLGLVGLDLELQATDQRGGKKVRRYGIPDGVLRDMVQIVRRRDMTYRRDTAGDTAERSREAKVSCGKLKQMVASAKERCLRQGNAAAN